MLKKRVWWVNQLRSKICLEIGVYFAVYILYLMYGLWAIYRVRDKVIRIASFEFATGWGFFGRPRDDSNDELGNFTSFIQVWWPWYILHLAVVTSTRKWWPQRQSLSHLSVCLIALLCSLRIVSTVTLFALLLSYYVVAQTTSKRLVWFLSGVWMFIINWIKNNAFWYSELDYTEYFTVIITLSWSMLRCCSYAFCYISEKSAKGKYTKTFYTVEHFLGYTLYFPTLIYGPFIGFQRYIVLFSADQTNRELMPRILKFVWELCRVCFWWLIVHVILHFLYIHYMERDVAAVKLVEPAFGQHAVGYFMGQLFFLYYVITYGLGISVAHFDGLDAPNRPRCIGCVHFYSDMWKYFDEGLYEFLFRHIYAELCSKSSPLYQKLFATAATFTFVFAWHGCYIYVLIWSFLNFSCLVAEKCFNALMSSPLYSVWVANRLGPGAAARLRALLATQIFIPAAFSNVYFISGREVGDHLMRGAYANGVANYFALTICSYCFFQCSELIMSLRKSE